MVLKLKEEFDKRYKTLTMCVDMSEAYKTYIAENGLADNSIERLRKSIDSFLQTNKKISEELSTLAILKLAQPVFAFISELSKGLGLGMIGNEFCPKIKSRWCRVSFAPWNITVHK